MALFSVINYTFNALQISIGAYTTSGTNVTYAQSSTLAEYRVQGTRAGLASTARVTAYSPSSNRISLQFSIPSYGTLGQNGTVVANNENEFVVLPDASFFGGPLLFANGALPADGDSVTIPLETEGVVYTPACYCAGTLIRAAQGDIAVERLAIGDLLPTVSGGVEPIVWIGARSYAGRFLAGNDHLQPVRFRAGSLGENAPTRDLLVSRKHAMLLDGVLVPAEQLVNGTTIVDERLGRVDYYHVELARHAAIWVEGAASETFVDDGSRDVFYNAHECAALQPGCVAGPVRYCAPRVEQGVEVDAIRARTGAVLLDTAA